MSSIAAGHPECCEAGSTILAAGGNAVDAAVAATLAAFVSEVGLTGPFGGGFALVAGHGVAPVAFDFFADVPGRGLQTIDPVNLDFKGVDVSFGPTTQTFHVGRGSVAVSSVLAGLLKLHQRFGQASWEAVSAPAIALAQQGTVLTADTVKTMSLLVPIMTATSAAAALYHPEARLPDAGERLRNEELARFIEGARPRLDLLTTLFPPPSGLITDLDIAEYNVVERRPLHLRVAPYDIYLNPPPSSGGALVAFGLRLLERNAPDSWDDEVKASRLLLAAMATTLAARSRAPLEELASPEAVGQWNPVMDKALHESLPLEPSSPLGSTTHVSVMDSRGLACAITSSNGEGSGVVIPRTGSMGNNFLGEDDLNPNGFHRNPVGERLTSMMCPIVVMKDGRPVMALGTGGSNRIRTALLQVLARIVFRGETLERAVNTPRFHYENDSLYLEHACGERRMPAKVRETLESASKRTVNFERMSMFFGGVHAVSANEAVGDPRRQGTARTLPV
ncbi:MAG: gamma-glutamyltransferase [Myxococcota bacterium]